MLERPHSRRAEPDKERIGTGKWRQQGVPHRGWTCVDIEDLGEPAHTCEMCEVMVVRYVHTMAHPNYETLDVGCICAGNMEQDLVGARRREANLKLTLGRRKRWLDRAWQVSAAGNDFLNAEGFNVVVYPQGDHWSARVEHRATGYRRISRSHYDSEEAAKLAALTAMLDMKRRLVP
jgi:hypothetical protein